MKRLFTYALSAMLLLGLFSSQLIAQKNWRWQNPLPQGNTLRGSASLAAKTIVMVGDAGTILKSKDGGLTWTRQQTNTRQDLYAISFVDSLNGMAVGTGGVILKTKDCGKTWERLISGRNDTLRGISYVSLDFAVAVGDTGTILRSKNGGLNWSYEPFPGIRSNLNGVFFPSLKFGMIVGDTMPGFGGPTIICTSDSGISYTPAPATDTLGNPLTGFNFLSVTYPKGDPNKSVLVGTEGKIVQSLDGGLNFGLFSAPNTATLRSVFFVDEQLGFAIGDGGLKLRTKNCGKTWTLLNAPTPLQLITATFPDTLNGYLGGTNGGLFETDDGGDSFTSLLTGFRPDLTSVSFLDDSFGIAVGGQGAILRTPNAGEDWLSTNSGTFHRLEDVASDSESGGFWAAGGTFGDSARIYFSGDSGISWTPQPIPSPFKLFGITFRDSLRGTAVGLNGTIFCTVDGGKTWTPKNSGVNTWLLDVDMPNDSTTYISGGFGTLLCSRDFGNTWTPLTSGTQEWLTNISFIDDSFGIAAGNHGTLLRTEDGGNNWQNISFPELTLDITGLSLFRSDRVSNAKNMHNVSVYVVGFGGAIFFSKDGGDNWEQQDSQTKLPLWGCYFTDSVTGTVVGELGTILRTDASGGGPPTGVEPALPISFAQLGSSFPNPGQARIHIPFSLARRTATVLAIYDLHGKEVQPLMAGSLPAGQHQHEWQTVGIPNGLYVIRLQAGKEVHTRKVLIQRP